MSNNERLIVEVNDGIATVTLNRPDKYNAVDQDMFFALMDIGEQLKTRTDVNVVILNGAGKGFCAGIDVSQFSSFADHDERSTSLLLQPSGHDLTTIAQQAAVTFKQLPMPVICALHGVAYGAGLQIALAADIRIASPETKLSVMEIKWGLIPDMGATLTLKHLVPIDVAKELSFTGRRLSGQEALELGLVTKIDENPLAASQALAAEINQRSPDAIRSAKALFEQAWNHDSTHGLALEAQLQRNLIGKENQLEAIKSNLENRPAQYQKPVVK